MPPKATSKRAAPASESKAKRAKTSDAPVLPKSKRWAAVSGSRNADDDFRLAVQDVAHANSYICICKPSFIESHSTDEDSEADSEDNEDIEDNDEDEDKPEKVADNDKPKCDGGKKCPCQKPATEHPEHRWIVTYAGFRKWIVQDTMIAVRNPDLFGMYTFNDHFAYGILETVQNLILDWVEAKTWQEQWAVCEALVLFLLEPDVASFNMYVIISLLALTVLHQMLDAPLTRRSTKDRRRRTRRRGLPAFWPPLPDHACSPRVAEAPG